MRFAFQREILSRPLFDELLPLLRAHHREISPLPERPLQPDFTVYRQIEHAGHLRLFTVRDTHIADMLVGYAAFYLQTHPHFQASLQATQDVLYVEPYVRQGLLGLSFIRWCDAQLQADGVEVIYQHVSVKRDFGVVLQRLGYAPIETTYVRRLV